MKNRALFRAKNHFLFSLPFVILKRNPPFIYKTRGTNRVIDKRSFAKRGRGLTFRVGRRSFSKPHLRPANAIHISSYLRVIPSAPHGCLLLINSGCQPIWSIIPELFRRQCRIDDIERRGAIAEVSSADRRIVYDPPTISSNDSTFDPPLRSFVRVEQRALTIFEGRLMRNPETGMMSEAVDGRSMMSTRVKPSARGFVEYSLSLSLSLSLFLSYYVLLIEPIVVAR